MVPPTAITVHQILVNVRVVDKLKSVVMLQLDTNGLRSLAVMVVLTVIVMIVLPIIVDVMVQAKKFVLLVLLDING